MKSFKQLRIDITEAAEKRYCPECEKWETRAVCRFGVEYWDKYAVKNFEESVLEGAAWTKKSGGLNEKGRKSYEKENPGSNLKAPSKKVGNPRRKSFCAQMKGMRKRQKKSNNTGDDRLSKSLRAWNC